jgi:hypothetical protein
LDIVSVRLFDGFRSILRGYAQRALPAEDTTPALSTVPRSHTGTNAPLNKRQPKIQHPPVERRILMHLRRLLRKLQWRARHKPRQVYQFFQSFCRYIGHSAREAVREAMQGPPGRDLAGHTSLNAANEMARNASIGRIA